MFQIDKEKFGSFVAELRKEKGYTQKELASKLFISDKAVSKWETSVSIPDTALLIPLADLLGVSVTELLMCERLQENKPMDTEEVEDIVKTAIQYSDTKMPRTYKTKSKWRFIFLLVCFIAVVLLFYNYSLDKVYTSYCYWTMTLLGMIFGVYFYFFVPTKLPDYYDKNKISSFSDGVFHINMVGIHFNNSNWRHIVQVGRIWSCCVAGLSPLIELLTKLSSASLHLYSILQSSTLFLCLGGLFIPIYVVGKKYE